MFLFVVVLNGEKALSKGGSLVTWQVATSLPCPAGICFLQSCPNTHVSFNRSRIPFDYHHERKRGCFSWFVDEWEKPPSAFPRDELLVLPSRSWSSTQLRRFETFNSQGVRSTLKIGLERFCGHFQGDSFTPPAEKAF